MFIIQSSVGVLYGEYSTRAQAIKAVKAMYLANKDDAPYMVYDCRLDHVEDRKK